MVKLELNSLKKCKSLLEADLEKGEKRKHYSIQPDDLQYLAEIEIEQEPT